MYSTATNDIVLTHTRSIRP